MYWSNNHSPSFIPSFLFKAHQVKHLPHPGPDPAPIGLLHLGAGQVGSQVRLHSLRHKQVVATQENFPHHIAHVAVVPEAAFGSQVIEAVPAWLSGGTPHNALAEALDHLVSFPVEFKADLPAGLHPVALIGRGEQPQQRHQAGLTTTGGADEQYPLPEAQPLPLGLLPVPYHVGQQLAQERLVLLMQPEMLPVQLFSFPLQQSQAPAQVPLLIYCCFHHSLRGVRCSLSFLPCSLWQALLHDFPDSLHNCFRLSR